MKNNAAIIGNPFIFGIPVYLKGIHGVCFLSWVTDPTYAVKMTEEKALELLPMLQKMESKFKLGVYVFPPDDAELDRIMGGGVG